MSTKCEKKYNKKPTESLSKDMNSCSVSFFHIPTMACPACFDDADDFEEAEDDEDE